MDYGNYSSYLVPLATAAGLYFSPYNTSALMAGLHGIALTYGTEFAVSGDVNRYKCSLIAGAGAALGYFSGDYFGFSPVVLSAIGGAGAPLLFYRS
jgi:hypothetical protein